MNRALGDPVSRLLTLAPSGERVDDAAIELRKRAAERYWNAWPQQRDLLLAAYKKLARDLARRLKLPPGQDLTAVFSQLRYVERPDGLEDVVLPDGEVLDPHTRFNLAWLASAQISDDALAMEMLGSNPFPIATPGELSQILEATEEELKAWPPVYALHNDEEDDYRDSFVVGVPGGNRYILRAGDNTFETFNSLLDVAWDVFPLPYATGSYRPDVRAVFRKFQAEFWAWYISENAPEAPTAATKRSKRDPVFLQMLAQPTFSEVKQLSRSFAHAPHDISWQKLLNEFALLHSEDGSPHNVRIEGSLIPEWWGRPKDSDSLMEELRATGQTGQFILLQCIALVVNSTEPVVDVDIDELIARVGFDPRSKKEREELRLRFWRILTIVGASRVIGARRRRVFDRATGKNVTLESQDPMLSVSAWKPAGTQESFDAGVAPLRVSLYPGPFLAQHRGNRRVLQDFGSLLALSPIPAGKPSGAWARAIGAALHQLWREHATDAAYARVGENRHHTAVFPAFTRRQLLNLFPPEPTLQTVLDGPNPARAIEYWDTAIGILRTGDTKIIGHYDGVDEPLRDWAKDRPRKGWADLWLKEHLDIRPMTEQIQALRGIAKSAPQKKSRTRRHT